MEIQLKYREMSGFEFTQIITKIAETPTTTQKAAHIRRVMKELERNRKSIAEEFKSTIMETFAKKDEDGKFIEPEGAPGEYITMDGKEAERDEAVKAFGEKLATINWRPLTPDTLDAVKLSAKELDLLGLLFSEENGPGVPGDFAPPPGRPIPMQPLAQD